MKALLGQHRDVTAVVTSNDLVALGAMTACAEENIARSPATSRSPAWIPSCQVGSRTPIDHRRHTGGEIGGWPRRS